MPSDIKTTFIPENPPDKTVMFDALPAPEILQTVGTILADLPGRNTGNSSLLNQYPFNSLFGADVIHL